MTSHVSIAYFNIFIVMISILVSIIFLNSKKKIDSTHWSIVVMLQALIFLMSLWVQQIGEKLVANSQTIPVEVFEQHFLSNELFIITALITLISSAAIMFGTNTKKRHLILVTIVFQSLILVTALFSISTGITMSEHHKRGNQTSIKQLIKKQQFFRKGI